MRAALLSSVLTACLLTSISVHADISFEPCFLTGSGGNGSLHAECAEWQRPLNPEAPDGEQITLFVARLASTAIDPAKDAFTVINGGPGGSSVDMMVDMSGILRPFTRERDVIVIDQRGTGRSAPMSCEALTDTAEEITVDLVTNLTKACLDDLPHDPRYFTTSVAVRDIEALREALGYEQLSVYGVSYGTRVAQHYTQRYPASTRALVIDSVVPLEHVLGSQIAIHSQTTLDSLFERCLENAACNNKFPNVAADFRKVAEELRRAPKPLQIQHPVTGVPTDIEVGYGHLAILVRLALYAPPSAALLPLIIDEAANNDNYLPVAANGLRMVDSLTRSINYGMHNAVMCTEDAPFFDDSKVDFEAMAATYLGEQMYETLAAMCDVWPKGLIDENIKEPLQTDVPTLVLSGEFDPITPPAWGDKVMPGLSNAVHLVAPGQGHGVFPQGCVPRLVLDFVEKPDPQAVDGTCTQHLSTHPFFVDLMGPPP